LPLSHPFYFAPFGFLEFFEDRLFIQLLKAIEKFRVQESFSVGVLRNIRQNLVSKKREAFFMNKFTNPLENIKIASPCKADWNEMLGDERKRFCGECQLNVYNLSGMRRVEAENLLIQSEGRVCVRFYKRADGTILTKDCPVGWQAIKRRVSKTAAAFVSLIFGLLSGLGINAYFNRIEQENVMGQITTAPISEPLNDVTVINPIEKREYEWVGRVSVPSDYPIAGGITNIDEVRQQVKKKRRR
jgi:hypothetical protein